jgi:3-oxoacyl-[acyl-carrier-protein] synthase-3
MSQMINAHISGWGSALPKLCVTNADLKARGIDTDDAWIVQRTGIKQRYYVGEGETTSTLATAAAAQALAKAGLAPADIGGIIVATTTPDYTFPATAALVQAALGVPAGVMAFDVQAVCSGFIYALAVANNFVVAGQAKHILVIGAETMSKILDWQDRTTCVLFGDGAGAVVLSATTDNVGVISTHLHADGAEYGLLHTTGGVGSTGTAGCIAMQGREVFKHAVTRMAEVVDEALVHNNLKANDIDWLVPHQANERIILATGEKLGLDPARVVLTVGQHGNTSAASVPLALAYAADQGCFEKGQLLLLEAMGAGLTWGAALVRWG